MARHLRPPATWSLPVVEVVTSCLREEDSTEALEIAAELLEVSPHGAAVTLHFQLAHKETVPDISTLDPTRHGNALLASERDHHDGLPAFEFADHGAGRVCSAGARPV